MSHLVASRLRDLLDRCGPMSVQELSSKSGETLAGVRRALKILKSKGDISELKESPKAPPSYRLISLPSLQLSQREFVPLDINRRIGGQMPSLAHLKTPARQFVTLGLPMAGEFVAREAA